MLSDKHPTQLAAFLLRISLALMLPMPLLSSASTSSLAVQSLDEIKETALAFARQQITIDEDETLSLSAKNLDSRLKLHQCDQELTSYTPNPFSRNLSLVGVRCEGNVSWKVFVSLNVQVLTPVVVANRPIVRGAEVQQADLSIKMHNKAQLRQGYYRYPKNVVGKRTKRHFSSGQAITPSHLKTQHAVKRGQSVVITAASTNVKVSAKGEALQSGQTGDIIKVRNRTSNKILEALVTSAGQVRVIL